MILLKRCSTLHHLDPEIETNYDSEYEPLKPSKEKNKSKVGKKKNGRPMEEKTKEMELVKGSLIVEIISLFKPNQNMLNNLVLNLTLGR